MEMIEGRGTDKYIDLVENQIRELHIDGFELGLHLHPQWYNAKHVNGNWELDYNEYNLCRLPRKRIVQIVDRSIDYLRKVLGDSGFTPTSFRAGNWLIQPSKTITKVLTDRGIKVDSSVYKGGVRHQVKLDYRRSLKNGYYWKFDGDINKPDLQGVLLEIPIHAQMVHTWKMFSSRRVGLERKGVSAANTGTNKFYRLLDFLRFKHPLKFDFCRMKLNELINRIDTIIKEDRQDPTSFKPIVIIGHTKELIDFKTIESFLGYLVQKGIEISTFKDVYHRCN